MTSKIVLILGPGPRVGTAIAAKFADDGYKVALVSRKGTNSTGEKGYLSLQADFANTDPSILAVVFNKVKNEFGSAPSVVVYNAASLTPPADQDSALSIPSARLTNDLNINVVSPFIAAQEAIKHWDTQPSGEKKWFIYTGNIMNVAVLPVPMMLTLGVGNSASAYWLGVTDSAYAAKGYRFIYADERSEDGKIKGAALDGPAHGDFYLELAASGAVNVPWDATFVKGRSYVKF